MEVSPKTLREVEFREKRLGGYHPDDVDEFLERVAVGIEVYQEKLRQATERVHQLERQLTDASRAAAARPRAPEAPPAPQAAAAAPAAPAAESAQVEEALKKTLLLAQRTADMAVAEAKQEAGEIVTKARAEARTLVESAQAAASKAQSDAEKELQSRLNKLEATRASLEVHVSSLRSYVDTEHARLRQGLVDAVRLLEENVQRMADPPVLPITPTATPSSTDRQSGSPRTSSPPSGSSARDAVRDMLAAATTGVDGSGETRPEAAGSPAAAAGTPGAPPTAVAGS